MRRSIWIRTMSVVISVSLLASLVVACSKVEIKKFEVSPEDIEVEVGSTVDLDVTLKTDPRDADIEIVYSSSDDSVAGVDDEGTITGISEGECEISISAGDEEKTVDVVVYELEHYQIGDTVSTDMFEFTLVSSELSYGAENLMTDDYLTPTTDYSNNPFVADTGTTLVILEVKVKNLNRTSSSIADRWTTGDWSWDWRMSYDGSDYDLCSWNWSLEYYSPVELGVSAVSSNGTNWSDYGSSCYIIDSGETAYFRIPTIVDVDVSDFSSPYDLVINIPSSDGENVEFIYSVNGD
ncbi:MAG: Ig-like domain-containing protein [Eubacterium sp.]|nr:Ig-like domain-containing protein [Eubacterium sp.]